MRTWLTLVTYNGIWSQRTSSIFLVNRCDHSEWLQGRKEHIRTDVPWFTYEINKKRSSLVWILLCEMNYYFFLNVQSKVRASRSRQKQISQTGCGTDALLWRVTTLRSKQNWLTPARQDTTTRRESSEWTDSMTKKNKKTSPFQDSAATCG